ncbi:MAG TPA: alpha/beta hydrolase-fold protein [Casimicrobiaceae bacterium]|jgi:enterochelin esterase-like enzyme|nr:alpha/beta hydrolase-fold protein [Casimicrobiaceae bacterium]
MLALLSGTFSEPEDFVREGFSAAVHDHGIAAELVMAEMRASWFADGSVVDRIREAVIVPAHERGRARIWLVGISLGGLAALCYAARHASEIEGILLISPYPATRPVLREMQDAGGIERWKPAIPPGGDLEREAWSWLLQSRDGRPRVHCYFASDDRFAPGQRQMAEAVAPERVRELPGGHDWDAWRALWREFLCNTKSALR